MDLNLDQGGRQLTQEEIFADIMESLYRDEKNLLTTCEDISSLFVLSQTEEEFSRRLEIMRDL